MNTNSVMLFGGTEETAPVALGTAGKDMPTWLGKKMRELSPSDMDAMFAFALADGKAKGFSAGMKRVRGSANPFHKKYLFGAPAMYFRTGYRLGREATQAELRRQPTPAVSTLELFDCALVA